MELLKNQQKKVTKINATSTTQERSNCVTHFFLRLFLFTTIFSQVCLVLAMAEEKSKSKQVIQVAIEVMGGQKYLQVQNKYGQGRYFLFDKREKSRGFTYFMDWTIYQPIKSRFQIGKKDKKRILSIHNLEINKGWILEGEAKIQEIPKEEMRKWHKSVRRNIHILLRNRLKEEGMKTFYYGPEDISGTGKFEAVEFIDASNDAVIVFFDLETHLPTKLEFYSTNNMGIRLKNEIEFHNWHTIQGVHTALRHDYFLNNKKSRQLFFEKVSYNSNIPAKHFLEPKLKK